MMKSLAVTSLLAVSAAALPELSISKRDKHNNGATANLARSVGIEARAAGTLSTNTFDVLSWVNGGAYFVNVTVGTPPQEQVVILDTGSSDTYFDASSAPTCQTQGASSCQGGTFNAGKSSTYKVLQPSPAFNTSYGDGSKAIGPFASDIFAIGDVSISNVQFGVAEQVVSTTGYAIGLMGVGYSNNEAKRPKYPNVPEVLVDAGVINSRLYSIFLNDQTELSGSILFGGIDKSKYTGNLVTLDLLPDLWTLGQPNVAPTVDQFITTVTAANATVNGKTQALFSGGSTGIAAYSSRDAALPVILDTGSSAWSVPESIYHDLFAPVFTYVEDDGACSCAHMNSGDSVTLEFGGKVHINVPAREFLAPLYNSTTREPLMWDDQNQACVFQISPAKSMGTGYQTLGDAILRSMYVVFDMDNGQVSIAQAAVNTTAAPNIVEVAAGPNGVAKAVSGVVTASSNTWSVASAVSATANYAVSTLQSTIGTATGTNAVPFNARPAVAPTAGGNSKGSSSGGSSASSSSPSKGAAAGLSVPGAADMSGLWVTSTAVLFAALGAGLML